MPLLHRKAGSAHLPLRTAFSVVASAALLHLTALPLPASLLESAGRDSVAHSRYRSPSELSAVLARWKLGPEGAGGLQAVDPFLQARINHLRFKSSTFAAAWTELEQSGIPILIGTREQLEGILPPEIRASAGWAGITMNWDGSNGRLERSAVLIRLEWIRALHSTYGTSEVAFLESVDRLLIHEIYGHLVPVVAAGTATSQCADPRVGEPPAESCVGRRELALELELSRAFAGS